MKKLIRVKRLIRADLETFSVRLEFDDGFVGDVDLSRLFEKPTGVFAEIMRGSLFEKCFVDSGTLNWPNGVDLCPDVLRECAERGTAA